MVCDHDFETGEYHGTYAYEPDTLTIPVGKTVVWRNDDIHGVSGVTNKGTNFNPGDQTNMSDKPDAMHQREFGGTHDVTFDLEHNDDVLVQSVLVGFSSPPIGLSHQTLQWEYTFLERGDFHYHCSIHPWMTGTVHVV